MGGKASRPLPVLHDSAKEVLTRRANLPHQGVLGLPLRKKVNLNEYDEKLHNQMTQVLNIRTVNEKSVRPHDPSFDFLFSVSFSLI
jgi:hypothetical protein